MIEELKIIIIIGLSHIIRKDISINYNDKINKRDN